MKDLELGVDADLRSRWRLQPVVTGQVPSGPSESKSASNSTTNANICTSDDFTKSVDALVSYIDPDNEEMKIVVNVLWRILGRSTTNCGLVVGTLIKPKLGLQPFGEAFYFFWQGGDFIKNDEPQGNQSLCQMNECMLIWPGHEGILHATRQETEAPNSSLPTSLRMTQT
ncbi:unnamed protein product [Durusdinium trenchii]|uniref:Uncharacterized protein n=2 Tax=Durusdinium trenchii TaxID=1381693 RepID=A0ABP0PWV5_9DINO